MKIRLFNILSLTLILALVFTSAVVADNLIADGDGLTPVGDNNLSLGNICLGQTGSGNVLLAITRQGQGQVFANSATVAVTNASIADPNVSLSWPDSSIALPPNWVGASNNTISQDTASAQVLVTAAGLLGSKSATIRFSASGDENGGGTLTRTDDMTVSWTVVACDTTPPVITPTVTGTEGNNGWFVSDVSVSWAVSDPESAITSTSGCETASINYDTTGVTLTCSATSAGGTASQSVTVKRDATAPTIVAEVTPPDPAESGWYTSAPVVTFTCTDATSGVAECPADYTFPDGENQSASRTVYDLAGNYASAEVTDIDVDTVAPDISAAVTPDAADTGWFNLATGAPTVTFTCSDDTSGVATCTDPFTFDEGADQEYTGTAVDHAGLSASATVENIHVDLTAPTITAALDRSPAATGWFNLATGAPSVNYTCADALSGIASCPTAYLFGEGAGQSHSATAFDVAGNSASAGVSGVSVDLTAPTLTWSGAIADGDVFYYGSVPPAPACAAADGLSGPAGCTVTGYANTIGVHTLTAAALDVAGNQTVETRTYAVLAWTLNGFFQPVDMNGVWNSVKGGSTVPLKFRVFAGPSELTDPGAVKSLNVFKVACDTYSPESPIEELAATGSTGLRYDFSAQQFIYNWKTPKTTGCYQVVMTTLDGTSLMANIKFK